MFVAAGVIYQLTIQIGSTRSPEIAEIRQPDIEPNSIAVLPLDNLSGDPEQAYFVLGLHEALIASLSRISALKVTSRTSTLRFQDTVEALPEVAKALGVAKLIEGSVYRVDDRVRITLQLIDAQWDEHILSQTFDSEVGDVLLLQSEVAKAIAEQVEVTLTPDEKAQLLDAKSIDPAAYDAFMKGQFHVERFTPQDMTLAAEYFQQAVELDPLNPFAKAIYAVQLLMVGEMEGAVRVLEDVTSSNPGFGFSHDILMRIYHHLGEQKKAIAAAADFIRITLV